MVVGVVAAVLVMVAVEVVEVAATVAIPDRVSSDSVSVRVSDVGSTTVWMRVSGRTVCSSSGGKASSSGAARSRRRKSSGWGDESVIASGSDQTEYVIGRYERIYTPVMRLGLLFLSV